MPATALAEQQPTAVRYQLRGWRSGPILPKIPRSARVSRPLRAERNLGFAQVFRNPPMGSCVNRIFGVARHWQDGGCENCVLGFAQEWFGGVGDPRRARGNPHRALGRFRDGGLLPLPLPGETFV